jgi:hypothetical protein
MVYLKVMIDSSDAGVLGERSGAITKKTEA